MSTRTSLLLSGTIIAATGVFVAIVYPRLPAMLPIHWDINGNVNGWALRDSALMIGFSLMLGMLLLMLALPKLSPKKFEIDTFRPTFNYIVVILTAMFAFFEIVTVSQSFAKFDLPRVLIAGMMLFLAALGNLLGKVKRNFYVGVRTPWTIASESNWIATHRLAARLMAGAGVLGAILVAAGVPLVPVFVLFMAAVLYPVLYSYLLYKRTEAV